MEPGHFHVHVHPISRGKRHDIRAALAYRHGTLITSAEAAAAYRHAQAHGNDVDAFDYRRKIGVQWFGLEAPDHAPAWMRDPTQLWTAVDRTETRTNARLAQEVIIALPHHVGLDDHISLLRQFARIHCVDRYGMIADIAIHSPPTHHGGDSRNIHAHILLTDRPITATGFARTKDRRYQHKHLVEEFRAGWTLIHNTFMEERGLPYRIDHRTLEAQRRDALQRGDEADAILLARLPQIHLGKAAHGSHPEASVFAERIRTNHGILKANNAVRERHQAIVQKQHHQAAHDALTEAATLHHHQKPLSLDDLRRRYGRLPALTALLDTDTNALAKVMADANGWTPATPPSLTTLLGSLSAWTPAPGPTKPWFTVTARDLAFVFYAWGLSTRANLQASLEHAAQDEASRTNIPLPKRPPRPRPTSPHLTRKRQLETRLGHIQAAIALHHQRELAFERRYILRRAAEAERAQRLETQKYRQLADRQRQRPATAPQTWRPDAASSG